MQAGTTGQLAECLAELQTLSETTFQNQLNAQVREILAHNHQKSHSQDLSAPPAVRRLLQVLRELLSCASMVDERQQEILNIVGAIVDPLLVTVTEQAAHLPTCDMAVHFLNVLHEIGGTLAVFEFVDARMERLNAQCDAQIETLVSEQVS